ncbi:MAG: M4 family metallopeptidase [Bacteroidetes bacterium]|nr:M4 family metallopeptidase [Bacteroidota bacterium]
MFSLFGQVRENEIALKNKSGNAVHFKFKETKVTNNLESVSTFLKTQFNVQDETSFRFKKKFGKDNIGFETAKIQQYYKGVKVEFSLFNAIAKEGVLTSLNGRLVKIANLNIKPKLSEEEALQSALRTINAEEYKWEDQRNENIIKSVTGDPNASYYPKGDLVILDKTSFSDEDGVVLVYKFDIYSIIPFQRKYYYIDANNGELIFANDILKHTNGTAATRYSGQRNIETEPINGLFRLRDNTRGNGIQTFDMNNGGSYSNATDMFDNDNDWNNTEYNNINKLNSMLDAHWAAEMTYDYFLNEHDFNSIDNLGFSLFNYVNADLTQISTFFSDSDNAFWDGDVMTYGIGTNLNPFVSLDIVAHEIGHGLFEKNVCNGCPSFGEFGAINEGLSDIWGSMIEFHAAPEKNTYSLGEEVGIVIRSMSNPKSLGDPDTYQGEFWWTSTADNGGIHTNNSILNHWFYLLAEGSANTDGINDNGDVFNIQGIGKVNAAKIIFRAETTYLLSNSDYLDLRAFTIQAAEDLFGVNSLEAFTACQSWFAVGVGDGNCSVEFEIAGNEVVCTSNTYTVTGLPPGASVSWSVTPNLQIVSSTSGSVTVSTSSNGQSGTIFLNVNGSISQRDIWLGRPASASKIFGPTLVNTGAIVQYSTGTVGGATSYEWRLPYPYDEVTTFDLFGQNWQLQLPANDQQIRAFTGYGQVSGLVQVWGKNACGNGGAKLLSVSHGTGGEPGGGGIPFNGFTNNGGSGTTIYPNPANDQIHVVFKDKSRRNIKFFNFQGILIKNYTSKSNTLDIEVSSIPNGIYLLEINQAGEKITEKIIVQH